MKKVSQIPYSKNPPPPPPLRKSNYQTMSYLNAKDRVAALEALARAYNSVASQPNIEGVAIAITESIKAEIAIIDKERNRSDGIK